MRKRFAKCFVAVGLGLALMVAQGCKRKAALTQPVVLNVPRVPTDFVVGALPFESGDVSATPKVDRVARQQQPIQLAEVQATNDQDAVSAAEMQRHKDERLLQEQQAASVQQQQELDREVQQNLKLEQEVEEEPRIQEAPEMPLPSALPGEEAPRIQDNPVSPMQSVPAQPIPPPS